MEDDQLLGEEADYEEKYVDAGFEWGGMPDRDQGEELAHIIVVMED